MLDRRTFLLGIPAAALAAGGLKAHWTATTAHPAATRTSLADSFTGLIGDQFTVLAQNGASGRMQLVHIRRNDVDSRLDQFSLRFRKMDAGDLPEGSHMLAHPALGESWYFLQPGSRAGDYCAGFCLLRS